MITFNKALLGKQAWHLLQNPLSLWSQLFKGLYHHATEFWHADRGPRPSSGWQSILTDKDSILNHLQWSVGDGKRISIREDKWLNRGPIGGPAPRGEPPRVADSIISGSNNWNEPLLRRSFDDQIVEEILKI